MGIGLGIFLMAVGAILAFAVHATVAGLDIRVVGGILMAAGFLSLALTLLVFAPRRRSTIVETHAVASGPVLGTSVVPTDVVSRETRNDVA
ncbi:MAG TPA: DUF6458 family protein [Actinomycetes bacterium]